MDQTKLQQMIAEFYEKLPADAQAVFGSMAWMDTLKEISLLHNLNPVQIEVLGTETTLVLLGIIHLDEYEEIVAKELGLSKELTETIISEVNNKVLKPLRPALEKAYIQNVEDINAISEVDDEDPIDSRFASLPQNLREAIINSDYQKKLYDIGTKHKLQVSQMASLEDTTVRFITGAISPTTYENEIALATDLPATTVKDLAKEVNDTILVTIRTYMQEHPEGSVEKPVLSTKDSSAVPVPPYAPAAVEKKDIVPKPPVTVVPPPVPQHKGILEDAGIEIVDNQTVAPKPIVSPSIITNKLFSPTKSQAVVSDHSLPKITPVVEPLPKPIGNAPAVKVADPYHEPI